MAHQTLYRKWRPLTFDDVVGQNHITATLKNEIVNNKAAHAYMFTGTRGTGKTSTAKILSRALNCHSHEDGNPCNKCPSCLGILNETILDVIEIDAASNTGVDNIREIIDQVRYTTSNIDYRVYIIDEVHMLSQGAFNALLKTLEEPPEHVVFILATTEIHKVPSTILSRCQRFDFKNISTSDIADATQNILTKENVTISREAVEYIAYLGNGSMRDALSITEQCLAYKENNISYEDVTDILGTLDDKILYNVAQSIALGDVKSSLCVFCDSTSKGKSPSRFAEGLLKALRDILVYKLSPENSDFNSTKKSIIEEVSPSFTVEKLTRCIDILCTALRDLKSFSNESVMVEATLIKLCSPQYEYDISALLDRISTLENKINTMPREELTSRAASAMETDKGFESARVPETVKTDEQKAPQEAEQNREVPIDSRPSGENSSTLKQVVNNWKTVISALEESGKLMTFVSLYGVKPKDDGDVLILQFETKDGAKSFSNSQGASDVKDAIMARFGISADIKCVFEEKTHEDAPQNNDIFAKFAQMNNNN